MGSKVRVGVIGLGMMGQTHLDVYAGMPDVEVVAIADANAQRLYGEVQATGNIAGQAKGGHCLSHVKRYADGLALIADASVDLVDVCVGTHLHLPMAKAALAEDKHLFIEKPMARSAAEAKQLYALAQGSSKQVMVGMCLRYWPAWQWLKQAIDDGVYGPLQSLHCQRLSAFPGGEFYSSGKQCGGALLDMHVHDTDFIRHCIGRPKAVFSRGYTGASGAIDHVLTQYLFDSAEHGSLIVSAEGGWSMAEGFAFDMTYRANFAGATVEYYFDGEDRIRLCHEGQSKAIEVAVGMGYQYELEHLIDNIKKARKVDLNSLQEAVDAMLIIEAEQASVNSGEVENLCW